MKIITCSSYYGCGSSALTDFISEFKCVKSLTDYEFRFIHDIDGISDLEHHLVECPNRHNSGHALKRFEKLSLFNSGTWFDKRYERFFGGKYKIITMSYINDLKEFSYKGFWFYDMYDRGVFAYYFYSIMTKLFAKFKLSFLEPLKNEVQYAPILSKEFFIHRTRTYIHDLMVVLNPSEPYLMIDQILPASNIDRCLNYFSDPIVLFVFDRDPRDIYILAKVVWTNEHIAPTDNPLSFCKWYKYARSCSESNVISANVVRVKFEDLIYRYDEVYSLILDKTGLSEDDHQFKFQKFNPRRSVINTRLWERYPQFADDIKIIERELQEYLFDYTSVDISNVPGVQPQSNHVF